MTDRDVVLVMASRRWCRTFGVSWRGMATAHDNPKDYRRRWLRWAAKVVPLFRGGRVPVAYLPDYLALEKALLNIEATELGIRGWA